MIIYPINKNYMLFFKTKDNILSVENKKIHFNLNENLRNKSGKG